MGCKSVKNLQVHQKDFTNKLIEEINSNETRQLEMIVNLGQIEIDEYIAEINEIYFNPLSYAMYKGSTQCFIFIHQQLKASIEKMEKLLISQRIYPLHFLSQKGNLELFTYYNEHTNLNFSLPGPDFFGVGDKVFDKVHNKYSYNAVQILSEFGFLHIMAYVKRLIKELETVPFEFDVEVQNEITGENCALIACRRGNYILIKFLQSHGADFNKKNILGENALQILCSANRKKALKEFYESFVFLVNSTNVDITYNYEETLLLIDNERLVQVFEEKLEKFGILAKKNEVEEKFGAREMNNHLDEEENDVKKIRFGTFIRELNDASL